MKNIKIQPKKPQDAESLLLMVYRYKGKKLVMSLNEKVVVKYWNFDKMRVRTNSNYPDHVRLNYVIDNWTNALSDAITSFELENIIPTTLELKERTKVNKSPETNINTTRSDKVIVELEKYIRGMKDEQKYSVGTIQSFDQLYNNFSSFANAKSITFRDLTLERLISFTAHLNRSSKTKKQYAQGTVNKLQRRLVQFLKYMKDLKVNVDDSYTSNSWRLSQPKVSGNDFALTKNEIGLIENVKLPKSLEHIRDRLLIGIYSGQRYSDFKMLTHKDIIVENGIDVIKIRQQKTSALISIPLTKKLKFIFDKHSGKPPIINEVYFNRDIKKILDIAVIRDEIKVETQYNGKIESKMIRKCDLIASHTCRRTFVTLAIQSGMPLSEVMKVSGHKNLKTLSQYMKGGLETNSDTKDLYDNLF